ncbi:endonuclease domain-containing protein [Streptomyces sp. NPDC053560]|uniref:endonuclease domain-containing protein n=1 Tax=Streptomyces sp. NPDC053560 TaxID=3365711 RepID=UPI0037D186C6
MACGPTPRSGPVAERKMHTGVLMAKKTCGMCGAVYASRGAVRYCGDACRLEAEAAQLAGSMCGLALEQARAIRAIQACMICQSTESGFESGIFAIDHCHDAGVVRGALCRSCNARCSLRRSGARSVTCLCRSRWGVPSRST